MTQLHLLTCTWLGSDADELLDVVGGLDEGRWVTVTDETCGCHTNTTHCSQ
jgi:hypothetical protein